MLRHDLLHSASGQSVPGHVDHIIGATHNPDVPILVYVSAVSGEIISRICVHVRFYETLVVLPEGHEVAGRKRQFHGKDTFLAPLQRLP